jgi:hypothetical protein
MVTRRGGDCSFSLSTHRISHFLYSCTILFHLPATHGHWILVYGLGIPTHWVSGGRHSVLHQSERPLTFPFCSCFLVYLQPPAPLD